MNTYTRYTDLTEEQRDAVHKWLNDHGIDHHDVPANDGISYDDRSGEWAIVRHLRDVNGRHFLFANEIARETVRFKATYDLPWPRVELPPWRCPDVTCKVTATQIGDIFKHIDQAHRGGSQT